jgi:pimeloyl-ACP methyl ester carboxylesterase
MTDQWIEVGGVKIRYVDTGGEGIPILLCSGIGGSLELWSGQLEALGDGLRLIAWDYPGHGLSDAGDRTYDPDSYAAFALNFMDVLGLTRVVVVGNSLGGAIALRMAGLAPDRVAGMVLASPAMTGSEVFLPFRLMTLPLLGEVMTKPGKLSVEQQFAALFHDPAVATDDLRRIVWRNVHKDGAAGTLLATLRKTLWIGGVRKSYWLRSRDLLKSAICPILLVHGKQDVVLPFQQSVVCAALAPRSTLRLIEGCGHTPQIESREVFNEALIAFVSEVSAEFAGNGIPASSERSTSPTPSAWP